MTYIDAQISCILKGALGKASCGVNSVRETLRPTNPTNLTIFESRYYRWPYPVSGFSPNLRNAVATSFMDTLDDLQRGSGASSMIEWYIKDPLTALNNNAGIAYANLGELDIKLFEQRFSLLWNTHWKVNL
jgi:hypothetical protein